VRRINYRAQTVLTHGITAAIHWVPGHCSITGTNKADRQASFAQAASRSTLIVRGFRLASSWAGQISDGRSVSKTMWEADKCRTHIGYRLKGKAGTKRPIPMPRVKSLAARFYQLRSGHALTGTA